MPASGASCEVLTTDALVEGVHFDLRFSSLADVGYKALAVNVSDIAAMGATPRLALLSLILPDRLSVADVDSLLDGVLRDGRRGRGDPRRGQHHQIAGPADDRRHGDRPRAAAAGS